MRVTVLLFAGLREWAGKGELELDLEPGSKVGELPMRLFPGVAPSSNRLRFAVNQEYVSELRTLKEGDEVALIPPVAGG